MNRMKRRRFLHSVGIATAGAIVAPYILPAGRLFASTGTRIANHVVFVLMGGGIRHQESIGQEYLTSQGQPYRGNIMRNMFSGSAPSSSNNPFEEWTPVLSTPLQAQGTLFQELHYSKGYIRHYDAYTAAITGNYDSNNPTVFEYYRKHSDPAKGVINCWLMGEGIGQHPPLSFSANSLYGSSYGANYLRPSYSFGDYKLTAADLPGIINSGENKEVIERFINETLTATQNNTIELPLPEGISRNEMTGDLNNIAHSWRVMNSFTPELMIINTSDADVCHSNFSAYLNNIHKTDYGVGWLWNKIQNHAVLANDTIMICMPDHGRSLQPNNIYDSNGYRGFDHADDDNSRRIFALIAGPSNKVLQGNIFGNLSNPIGETIDIVPTIGHILGFKDKIPNGFLSGTALTQAFV
jgi:hypothetical protein